MTPFLAKSKDQLETAIQFGLSILSMAQPIICMACQNGPYLSGIVMIIAFNAVPFMRLIFLPWFQHELAKAAMLRQIQSRYRNANASIMPWFYWAGQRVTEQKIISTISVV